MEYMHTVIFMIYTISLVSALVCVWVKWEQESDKQRITGIEKNHAELKKQIEQLQTAIKKAGIKDPFTKG